MAEQATPSGSRAQLEHGMPQATTYAEAFRNVSYVESNKDKLL